MEEIKLSLFAGDILHTENPKKSPPKNCLGTTKWIQQSWRIQEIHCFLYTNNELLERDSKKTILFKIASKRTKYLGKNLTKEIKDLYFEKYKTLVKETEIDT